MHKNIKEKNKAKIKTKIKTQWDLTLLYKSPKDPQIEKDIRNVEKLNEALEKKYRNADFTSTKNKLLKALKDYENYLGKTSCLFAFHYFALSHDLNSEDREISAMLNKLEQRLTRSFNKTFFFPLEIQKIKPALQKKYLVDEDMKHFHYFLKNLFDTAKYSLSDNEEKILSVKSLPARSLWIKYSSSLLSRKTVSYKKKLIPINEALSLLSNLPTADRRALSQNIFKMLYEVSDFAEAEINAVYTDKKINDELRGYKNPYDATLLSHETDEKTVFALDKAVKENYNISHDFYKIKAKLLKLEKLYYCDRGASIGEGKKKINFEEARQIVGEAFYNTDPEFRDILESYLKKGQIDVYPEKGKTGGAYCASQLKTPTFVLLNHTSSMSSAKTLAHEMGHAIHSEYTRIQSPIYFGWSTATAEVASTFFEEVVFNDFFKTLDRKDKIIALHDKINDNVSTIFRQIAVFNFELELHKNIREKGEVSKSDMAKLMNKHMKSYLGPAFELKDMDGYFFVNWSHIRNFFYVYSYSYGALVSRALYKKYKEDKNYLYKIKVFLSAGVSKSPYQIFKDIGIDTSNADFWKAGLKEIESDIKLLERLAKEAKMI